MQRGTDKHQDLGLCPKRAAQITSIFIRWLTGEYWALDCTAECLQIWWTEKKKIMSLGFKRFPLMCTKHFHETHITTQICYLAIMGHVRAEYLLISCWDDSMHHEPVLCWHEMSVRRFTLNELITLKYQLKGAGHILCLFSCPDVSCLLIQCANVVFWIGSILNPLCLINLCTDT